MIFVTVGTQLPFPRLVRHMAHWATQSGERVVLQTGDTHPLPPCEAHEFLTGEQCNSLMEEARIVVSHAGIGSILAAQSLGRPLIVVPRRAHLGEHRSDHQFATAAVMDGRCGLRVAWEVEEIGELLGQPIETPLNAGNPRYHELVDRIRCFVTA